MLNFLVSLFAVFTRRPIVAKVIVPVRDNEGQSLAHVVEQTIEAMVDTFGGATVTPGLGFWRDPETGVLFKDRVRVIESATQVGHRAARKSIAAIARQVMADSDQLAVFTQVDGEPRILDRE